MELRQLRYFVRCVECGSISQAALDLGIAQSAVSLQIQRLESELSVRLLVRGSGGATPTDAGVALLSHARLALRHADDACRAARQARLAGTVNLGLAATTCGILGLPLVAAMRSAYPDIHLHLVEGMSGHLGQMLNARELDLAVLFDADQARRWHTRSLLHERIFFVCSENVRPTRLPDRLADIADTALVLPTPRHGLRRVIDSALAKIGATANVVVEVDSLHLLMDIVVSGMAATLQPWSALARRSTGLAWSELSDADTWRPNLLCSLSDEELSPAAMATRRTLERVVRDLVAGGTWRGVVPS